MRTVNIIVTSIIFLSILIVSCKKKDIEVMHTYPFKVETLPVLQTISSNDPIEIRCNLKVDDMYNKAIYTIRYFQYSGSGRVYIGSPESNPMYPNERYPLSIGSFRLYYIPYDKNDIEIEFVIEDNNGQTQKLNYSIKYQDNKKE